MGNSKYIWLLSIAFIVITLISCSENSVSTPKPRMYPRVIYPAKNYINFDTTLCSFGFRYADFNKIVKDSFKFEGKPADPCWFDLRSKDLNTSLHCSYYNINDKKDLSSLIDDAFNLAGKHNVKANYRKETIIENKYGVKGILFDIEGPVASPTHFYKKKKKNHFFRASLYFNSKVNPDSTAPILTFVKQDIDTLIATFRWK